MSLVSPFLCSYPLGREIPARLFLLMTSPGHLLELFCLKGKTLLLSRTPQVTNRVNIIGALRNAVCTTISQSVIIYLEKATSIVITGQSLKVN